MAEWSIAAVLKTVEGHTSGGSNPSLSAKKPNNPLNFSGFHNLWTLVVPPVRTHLYTN